MIIIVISENLSNTIKNKKKNLERFGFHATEITERYGNFSESRYRTVRYFLTVRSKIKVPNVL